MEKRRKIEVLKNVLGTGTKTKGDELVAFCPKCFHKKPKLSVNLTTDKFHCWFCSFSGHSLVPLLRFKKDAGLVEEYIKTDKKEAEPDKKFDKPILPSEYISLSSPSHGPYYSAAMNYLTGRGITKKDILLYKLGYCEAGPYKNRIIIPSFDSRGELNFFVGRAFYENMSKFQHGNFSKDIIFNEYLIDWKQHVVLTEGPFDMMKAGKNAITLQGSALNPSSTLFNKIVTENTDVYFALDSDAFKKQVRMIKMFLRFGVNSWFVDIGENSDVGDMKKEEFVTAKELALPITSTIDLLKLEVRL